MSKRISALLSVPISLCIFLAASVLFAQSVEDAPKNTQALAVAQHALIVMGARNLVPNQSAQAIGTLTLHGESDIVFPVVLKSAGTQRLRTEITTNTGLRLFVVNGGRGIIRQPDGSVRQLADENMIVQRINHIPALSLLGECLQKNVALDYIGTSTLDDAIVEIVAVSLYSGATVKDAQSLQSRTRILYYVDAKTGLVIRIDRANYAENNPNEVQNEETYLSDYRLVNGIMIPFQQRTLADGKPYLDLVLTSVTFGVAVNDSDFSLGQ